MNRNARVATLTRPYDTVSLTMGLLHMASLVMAVLKLAGVLDWSWWLVLAPSWSQFAFFGTAYIIGWLREPPVP